MLSLQADGLTKKYNRQTVFENLSFSHNSGVLGISGSNGSGKSTLLKCLSYLIRPNKGTFTWKENNTELSREEAKSCISYVAPYINLYTELTARENLEFLLEVSGNTAGKELISDIFNYVQMSGFGDKILKNMSTGQNQRIKLAAALVRKPRILFMDEPGSNLDEEGHRLVAKIVEDQKAAGSMVIIASNDPNEIALCDNVIALG
jgi:ABC-type multidrug transport system ATPase subunit